MSREPERRKYDSLRRTEQALLTRAGIAEAARRLFVAHGWTATTVRDVAKEAGVSVPTVYSAYGDKAGLLRALADSTGLAADIGAQLDELEDPAAGPGRQLAAMAAYDRRLFERAGDVIALIREAGRTDPDFAAAYLDGRGRGDRTREQVFLSWPKGTLRPGLDIRTAVDVYAAVCNIDVYTTLTVERGWTAERVEAWWGAALGRELLA
ncbi:helix-turn-helix domain-containing protein [Phytomonospora sp. NPDC050363]|uniref:TetR/AcrR family transcriptional regulator n=1 Tax=Phytomonospora sp. NPDC050363 TaxID=3155642 RepID=UPI0033FAEFB3